MDTIVNLCGFSLRPAGTSFLLADDFGAIILCDERFATKTVRVYNAYGARAAS